MGSRQTTGHLDRTDEALALGGRGKVRWAWLPRTRIAAFSQLLNFRSCSWIKLDQVGSSWKFGRLGSLQMPQLHGGCGGWEHRFWWRACRRLSASWGNWCPGNGAAFLDIEASNLCRRFGSEIIHIDSLYDVVMQSYSTRNQEDKHAESAFAMHFQFYSGRSPATHLQSPSLELACSMRIALRCSSSQWKVKSNFGSHWSLASHRKGPFCCKTSMTSTSFRFCRQRDCTYFCKC